MDPDELEAAWHQLECEAREYNDELAQDTGYEQWLNELEQEYAHDRYQQPEL